MSANYICELFRVAIFSHYLAASGTLFDDGKCGGMAEFDGGGKALKKTEEFIVNRKSLYKLRHM